MLAFVASPHVYNMTHPCSGICREPLWAKGFLSSHRFPAIHPSSSSIHPRHPSIHCQRCHVRHVHPTKTPIPGNGKHPPPTRHILHPYGTHSVRRAQTTRLGPTGEFFFLLLFFFILTTPTACVSHQHAIYSTHTAPTGCVGPERVIRAPQVSFFFFYYWVC